jgi:hypothetical protein
MEHSPQTDPALQGEGPMQEEYRRIIGYLHARWHEVSRDSALYQRAFDRTQAAMTAHSLVENYRSIEPEELLHFLG